MVSDKNFGIILPDLVISVGHVVEMGQSLTIISPNLYHNYAHTWLESGGPAGFRTSTVAAAQVQMAHGVL